MKAIVLIIILFLLLPSNYAQQSGKLLKKAYRNNSVEMLESFCEAWSNEAATISAKKQTSVNDTITETCKIFQIFFHAYYSNELNVFDSNFYHQPYMLVPNKINSVFFSNKVFYSKSVTDSIILIHLLKEYDEDTVDVLSLYQDENGDFDATIKDLYGPKSDFNPENKPILKYSNIVNYPNVPKDKKALCLTGEYYYVLSKFLFKGNYFRKKSFEKKVDFLQNQISICTWQLFPQSFKISITIDKNFEFAEVLYNHGVYGSAATLKKDVDNWEIIELNQLNEMW